METLRSNGSFPPVFTTSEAMDLTGMSVPAILRVWNAGKLGGYTVPYSDRLLIPALDLAAFCREKNIKKSIPLSREILIVTTDIIRDRVATLLEQALDAVTIHIATPDEEKGIDELQRSRPALVTYRHGDGSKEGIQRRVSASIDTILENIRQDTLLRCDLYEGNGHAHINGKRLKPPSSPTDVDRTAAASVAAAAE